jgi:EAL domain-containing protein (putative c-di-GMP-specific phosphodiesterase class I)
MRPVKAGGESRARSSCGETALPNFTMAFQPIVDIETGVVYAQEALVRPIGGGSAVDVLGQVGRRSLHAFDRQCRVKAIALAASLGMRGFLHINFLPNANYEAAESVRETLDAAERAGFPFENLVLEVAESERARDSGHLRAILDEYRSHGMMSAIDDFGALACGLNLFAGFEPDVVKIDMAHTRGIESDRARLAITRYVVGLCRELDITVIAEGVETLAEAAALRDIGVRLCQGYLLARPALERLPAPTAGVVAAIRQAQKCASAEPFDAALEERPRLDVPPGG